MKMAYHVAAAWLTLLAAATGAQAASYAGSEACQSCHAVAYEAWKTSHHYQAMLPVSEETVLGDFGDRAFEYGGVRSLFYRRDGRFMVETDNRKGELQDFEIAYTFGFYPLQQYLIAFPDGRLQALNVVWDSRRKEQGGQRWIHLYPDPENPVLNDDIVHWTGAFQNWNSRCASCHSTGLEKNYSAASNRYETGWQEINVACEACHGPAVAHVEWAGGDRRSADKGFSFSLADRGAFGPDGESASPTFARLDGKRPATQVETCAACHARRSELALQQAGTPFNDLYRLSLVEPGLYHADGQVNDEVYVYGSFLQSKMHAAGVVCTNCHEPHSNKVLFDDNRLCSQCHDSAVFDAPGHHHHQPGSDGAACVNCHMPAKTYMVVDDRRDHGFRVPEPRLSRDLGVPNSCNQCHVDKDPQWAISALDEWGVGKETRARHAPVLAAAWSGDAAALSSLFALAGDTGTPAILRASAVVATGRYPSQQTLANLQPLLTADHELVRAAVARSLDWLPPAQRYAVLRDLIGDSSKSVRMAVARQLAGIPAEQLPGESATELLALRAEYQEALRFNADMPEEQMNLGLFLQASGDPVAAEKAYNSALKLSPQYTPALMNLADLYRANGMDKQAEPLLQKAIELAPDQAPQQHAMGLLRVRQGQLEAALPYLQRAARLGPANDRYSYVYAVALWETGNRSEAVTELEAAVQRFPGNRQLLSALASYYEQLGEQEKLQAIIPFLQG
jgi:predicted CXXCH cytochrome family protein